MAKVSEVVRLLIGDGWFLYKHGKKHDLYRHPVKPNQIALPRHGASELARGTYFSILKDAGLHK